MGDKKVLVVHYSRSGTTRKLAEAIASVLNCDIEEIRDTTDRSGLFGWLRAGRDAFFKKLTVLEDVRTDPGGYDLVVIGTPVWAGSMSCATRTYISQFKGRLKEVVFFATMGNSVGSTFRQMEELCGKKPLACLALKTKRVRKGDFQESVEMFIEQMGL